MTNWANPVIPPVVFLCGPPGAGKSSLGSRVCQDLGLEFLDLSPPASSPSDPGAGMNELQGSIADRSAEVVAIPWGLGQDTKVLSLARRYGDPVLLWAHPLDMQVRSGHEQPLFTPVSRLKTQGGFGRNGTGCKEFRRFDRACPYRLLLVGVSFDEAAEMLKDLIVWIRAAAAQSPIERAGLEHSVDKWRGDHNADLKAAQLVADAIARYILYLRGKGASPRTLSDVYQDMDVAAMLLFMYESPTSKEVLRRIPYPPSEFQFKRKISDSPYQVARFHRNLERFAGFLKQSGLIAEHEGQTEHSRKG